MGVDAAVAVDSMAKFHKVKLYERETLMSNWPFNMDVIGFGRAHTEVLAASH